MVLDWCCICKNGGNSGPSSSSLLICTGDLVHGSWPFWSILGYAEKYLGAVGVLAGQLWEASKLFDLGSCPTLFDVVHLEST
jgi:hypothetical protein